MDDVQRHERNKKKFPHLEHWQVITAYLILYDVFAVNIAYFFALWVRFDCGFGRIPEVYLTPYLRFIPIYSVFCIFVFWNLRLYRSIWRFASYNELARVTASTVITGIFHAMGITVLCRVLPESGFLRMPVFYYVFGTMLQFFLVLLVRFSYRFVLLVRSVRQSQEAARADRVMLIGAGSAGQMILRDLNKSNRGNGRVCCIIDDNSNKWNRYIDGVPIVGGRESIHESVEKYAIDKIFFAIPTATAEEKRDILSICNETGCELKSLPGIYQLVNDEVTVSAMKDVAVEDLLGREPIKVDLEEIFAYLKGKVILVTGGGGSIGSELCRQIAGHSPRQLIIFDIYENNAYDIQLELKRDYPDLDLKVLIGSVRDSRRLDYIFDTYRPEVVYHAAAHKHVPLMEDSPREAIKNNVFGTYKTAYAAMKYGCARFVLISTDKAVNPTNIMGASKRLCEMVIQTFSRKLAEGRESELPVFGEFFRRSEDMPAQKCATEFVAVRFGNVLGSNGSVIPLFKKQIEEGGPVTVTHPDIIRYFMTIPEAVSLVLQACVYGKGGEIFVLDMGSPMKIDTLARNLIRLSGYKPDVDIKIVYTGLRPGEKLYEEKLMAEEGLRTTPNELIHIGAPITFDEDALLKQLGTLNQLCHEEQRDIGRWIEDMVGTYHPAETLP